MALNPDSISHEDEALPEPVATDPGDAISHDEPEDEGGEPDESAVAPEQETAEPEPAPGNEPAEPAAPTNGTVLDFADMARRLLGHEPDPAQSPATQRPAEQDIGAIVERMVQERLAQAGVGLPSPQRQQPPAGGAPAEQAVLSDQDILKAASNYAGRQPDPTTDPDGWAEWMQRRDAALLHYQNQNAERRFAGQFDKHAVHLWRPAFEAQAAALALRVASGAPDAVVDQVQREVLENAIRAQRMPTVAEARDVYSRAAVRHQQTERGALARALESMHRRDPSRASKIAALLAEDRASNGRTQLPAGAAGGAGAAKAAAPAKPKNPYHPTKDPENWARYQFGIHAKSARTTTH